MIDQFSVGATGREEAVGLEVVGRLETGTARGRALGQLRAWDMRHTAAVSGERPATSLELEPRRGTVPVSTEVMAVFMPLFFAFGLILLIGCANVANLLLARAVTRQREIGIRLSIGASRRRIVWQLLTEGLLLALVSAVLAWVISRLALRGVVFALTTTFPPDVGNLRVEVPRGDWRVASFLVVGAMLSTTFFALAPALQATRVDLVRAIRGQVGGTSRPGGARNFLVALQVSGAVLLLVCAALFLRSTWAAEAVEPGIRTAGVVNVSVVDEAKRDAILSVVRSDSAVESIAASWPGWLGVLGGQPAIAKGAGSTSAVTYQFVSSEYFEVLGIDIVRGRGFTSAERSASSLVAVVSERVARELWRDTDAVGQVLRLDRDTSASGDGARVTAGDLAAATALPRTVDVVGVSRDVPGFRLGAARMGGADVSLPISVEAAATSLTMSVRGDVERVRRGLVDRLAAIDPNMAEVSTLQTIARTEAYLLSIPFWLTLVLGTLALFLTLSGLYSLLSYLVVARSRDIGVRMALGATTERIGAFVLAELARPVGIGLSSVAASLRHWAPRCSPLPRQRSSGRACAFSIPSHTASACCASWRHAQAQHWSRRYARGASTRSRPCGRTD